MKNSYELFMEFIVCFRYSFPKSRTSHYQWVNLHVLEYDVCFIIALTVRYCYSVNSLGQFLGRLLVVSTFVHSYEKLFGRYILFPIPSAITIQYFSITSKKFSILL